MPASRGVAKEIISGLRPDGEFDRSGCGSSACRAHRRCSSRPDRSGASPAHRSSRRSASIAMASSSTVLVRPCARSSSSELLGGGQEAVEDGAVFGAVLAPRRACRQPFLIGRIALAQPLAKHRLQAGEAVEAEMLGKADQASRAGRRRTRRCWRPCRRQSRRDCRAHRPRSAPCAWAASARRSRISRAQGSKSRGDAVRPSSLIRRSLHQPACRRSDAARSSNKLSMSISIKNRAIPFRIICQD